MGITIDKDAARGTFAQALELARARTRLPAEWIERAKRVGTAVNKTFTPMLGTALLAKATDWRIDPSSLREGASHKSYSARGLAKDVLVPHCVAAGIYIRNTGAEPLNNQPFLRAERVSRELEVKPNARADLDYLCTCLEQIDFFRNETDQALMAFAAFLRARLEASEAGGRVVLGAGVLPLADLGPALDSYVAGDCEGGKTGQACVAAIFDIVFTSVQTKRINDPSNKWPGDVGAFDETGHLVVAAEVKQRPFSDAELLLFSRRLAQAGVGRGFVAAFDQDSSPLAADITQKARQLHGVELEVFFKPSALLRQAMLFADADLPTTLPVFPRKFLDRLNQLEVSTARREEWVSLFESRTTG